jgi:hypothetical protein
MEIIGCYSDCKVKKNPLDFSKGKTVVCDVCGVDFHLKCTSLTGASVPRFWICVCCCGSVNEFKSLFPILKSFCSDPPSFLGPYGIKVNSSQSQITDSITQLKELVEILPQLKTTLYLIPQLNNLVELISPLGDLIGLLPFLKNLKEMTKDINNSSYLSEINNTVVNMNEESLAASQEFDCQVNVSAPTHAVGMHESSDLLRFNDSVCGVEQSTSCPISGIVVASKPPIDRSLKPPRVLNSTLSEGFRLSPSKDPLVNGPPFNPAMEPILAPSTASVLDSSVIPGSTKQLAKIDLSPLAKIKYIVFADSTAQSTNLFLKNKDIFLVKCYSGFNSEQMVRKIISTDFTLFTNLVGIILHVGAFDLKGLDFLTAVGGVWDLVRMTKQCLPSHVKIIYSGVLCNSRTFGVKVSEFNKELSALCKSESVFFFDPNIYMNSDVLSKEGLNLNKKGGRLLSDCWSKFSKLFCAGDCYNNALVHSSGNSARASLRLPT